MAFKNGWGNGGEDYEIIGEAITDQWPIIVIVGIAFIMIFFFM